jgi:hypothetical protein
MKQHTGCEAVMIARAAIGNPWIFQRKDIEQVTLSDKTELIRRHLGLMVDFYGEEHGLVLFRKHVVKYVRGLSHIAQLRAKLMTCIRSEEFIDLVKQYETEFAERQPSLRKSPGNASQNFGSPGEHKGCPPRVSPGFVPVSSNLGRTRYREQ